MRFSTDGTWNRVGPAGRMVLAGSPLRLFRLTAAGAEVCASIESNQDVAPSVLIERLLDAGAIHPLPTVSNRTPARRDVTVITPQLGGSAHPDRDITVDDGSEPPVRGATIRLDRTRGPGAARNAGRREASTPLLAFVDADVSFPDPDWIDRLLPHFDDPLVGLVAPRVIGDPTASLDLGANAARVCAGSRVSYVPAAAIVVRARAFDDVGGFDERLRFGEDVDLVWRLHDAGWRCRYEPAVNVHHAPRSTLRARLRQHVGYGSSAGPLAVRHPRSLAPMRANPWMATSWAAIGLGHPVVASLLAAANAVAVARRLTGVPATLVARLTGAAWLVGIEQSAATIRRVWWPLALGGCLMSRRARLATVAALAAGGRSTPTDLAYGAGVWLGMFRQRTARPILPRIGAWEPEREHPRRAGARGPRPAAGGR